MTVAGVIPADRFEGLSWKEQIEVRMQAHHLQRSAPGAVNVRRLVTLPAPLMACLLGRSCSGHGAYQFTAWADTDYVTCGAEVVWKTGGGAVVSFCLARTSEAHLARMDEVEWMMWKRHCERRGLPYRREGMPVCMRDGVPVEPAFDVDAL